MLDNYKENQAKACINNKKTISQFLEMKFTKNIARQKEFQKELRFSKNDNF